MFFFFISGTNISQTNEVVYRVLVQLHNREQNLELRRMQAHDAMTGDVEMFWEGNKNCLPISTLCFDVCLCVAKIYCYSKLF